MGDETPALRGGALPSSSFRLPPFDLDPRAALRTYQGRRNRGLTSRHWKSAKKKKNMMANTTTITMTQGGTLVNSPASGTGDFLSSDGRLAIVVIPAPF